MLGTINPQVAKIDARAVVYPGRNHVVELRVSRLTAGRRYEPVDLDDVTRIVLTFPHADPALAFDSLVVPDVFSLSGTTMAIDLSDYAIPTSILAAQLVVYDAEHADGQVLIDNVDTQLNFDFRNVASTGTTAPPFLSSVLRFDAVGTLAERTTYDSAPAKFTYLATDTGLLYTRQGASGWTTGVKLQGPPGPTVSTAEFDDEGRLVITLEDGTVLTSEPLNRPWGTIAGTITDQADLMALFGEKVDGDDYLQFVQQVTNALNDRYTQTETDNLLAGKADGQSGTIAVSLSGDNSSATAAMSIDSSGRVYAPKAFASIIAAAEVAPPGSLIIIYPGTYIEAGSLPSRCKYYAMPGVTLLNPQITVTDQSNFGWYGEADVLITDATGRGFSFTSSASPVLRFRDVLLANAGASSDRAFVFVRSSGACIQIRDGRTNNKSLFAFDDEWTGQYETNIIKARNLIGDALASNPGSTTSAILAALRGSRVEVSALTISNANNPCLAIGTIAGSVPGKATETSITLKCGSSSGNVLARYFNNASSSVRNILVLDAHTTRCGVFANYHFDPANAYLKTINQSYSGPVVPAFVNVLTTGLNIIAPELAPGPTPPAEWTTLTISGDSITLTGATYYFIDTESSASTDTLTTINGASNTGKIVIRPVSVARDITVDANGLGNIADPNGSYILGAAWDIAELVYNPAAAKWQTVSKNLFGA